MNNQMNQSLKKPPVINIGVIGWLRQNLFSTWYNTILTFLGIYILYVTIPPFYNGRFLMLCGLGKIEQFVNGMMKIKSNIGLALVG